MKFAKVMFSQLSVCPRSWGEHAWHRGVHGRGACVVGWGACMAGVCVAGACMSDRRRPLQRVVRILLECILVFFFVLKSLVKC